MKSTIRVLLLALFTAFASVGCDYDDDDDYDDDVPPGKGLLIVDNNSADEIAVYVDGVRLDNVDDYDDRKYSVEPGVRRVVLDQRSGGDRGYRGDVDIIEGKRTVLDVAVDTFDDEYDVRIFFD